jgi:hypothetical protein
MEGVITIKLTAEEDQAFRKSVQAVRDLMVVLNPKGAS